MFPNLFELIYLRWIKTKPKQSRLIFGFRSPLDESRMNKSKIGVFPVAIFSNPDELGFRIATVFKDRMTMKTLVGNWKVANQRKVIQLGRNITRGAQIAFSDSLVFIDFMNVQSVSDD